MLETGVTTCKRLNKCIDTDKVINNYIDMFRNKTRIDPLMPSRTDTPMTVSLSRRSSMRRYENASKGWTTILALNTTYYANSIARRTRNCTAAQQIRYYGTGYHESPRQQNENKQLLRAQITLWSARVAIAAPMQVRYCAREGSTSPDPMERHSGRNQISTRWVFYVLNNNSHVSHLMCKQ